MTKQEIFDKVLARAAIPVKSMHYNEDTHDNSCAYRPDDYPATPGCFVGIFLTDEVYDRVLEMKPVGHMAVRKALFLADVLDERDLVLEASTAFEECSAKVELLYACQRVHDTRDPVDWQESLRMLATNHDVEFHWPVPNKE